MSELLEEVRLWNTPAIGAYYLFRFTQGYVTAMEDGDAPIALYHFIAIAILTNEQLKSPISNQRENLQSYVRSFEDRQSTDILLGIQTRIKEKLKYTWSSIDFAVANGLLYWDFDNAKLFVRPINKSPGYGHSPKASVKREGDKAEILGRWFSEHNFSTITAYLKIIL